MARLYLHSIRRFSLSRPRGLFLLSLTLFSVAAHARAQRPADFGMMYTQEKTKFVGANSSDYFTLRGASLDYSQSLWKGLGVAVSGTGLAGTNEEGYIDIQHIELMVGPRYTYNLGHISPTAWGRRGGIFAEGKIGYTFATSGLYPVNGAIQGTAAGLTYEGGGGINLHIYQRFDLRLIEVDAVRTQLPNGTTNVQNTLRLASGLNFHFGY